MVTVCKAAGGAVCDRRAINFRSKAGKSEQARPRGPPTPWPTPRACPRPAATGRPRRRAVYFGCGTARTETLRDALLFSQPMDRSAEVRTTKGTTRLLGHIASSTPPYYRKAFTLTRRKRKGLPRCVIIIYQASYRRGTKPECHAGH